MTIAELFQLPLSAGRNTEVRDASGVVALRTAPLYPSRYYEVRPQAVALALNLHDGLLAALQRLTLAAERRDSTMGDVSRLLDAKAELAAAAKAANEVLGGAAIGQTEGKP